MEDLIKIFKQRGIKITSQRVTVYQALLEHDGHPTAEQIFEKVKPLVPGISLGTVYKTLDTLVQSGLVKKVSTGDDRLRFDARLQPHHHIMVEGSNEIIDFQDDTLHNFLSSYIKSKKFDGLEIQHFQVQLFATKNNVNQ